MSEAVAVALFVVGIQLMAPILWAALGELVSERAGVLNVGIEGCMLLGAFAAALTGARLGSPLAGIAVATLAGLAAGALLAFLYVRMGTDQIVTGLLFNVFALGLTDTLHDRFLGGTVGDTLPRLRIPVLGDLPYLGEIVFQQHGLTYLAVGTVVLVGLLMQRTWWGLYARAVGERPYAVEAGGLDVWRLRYPAVLLGCMLPAIGGAALVLSSAGGFVPGMTAGRGFIALGVVVLARWKPLAVLAASLLFGLAQSLQFVAGGISFLQGVPSELWLASPYVATVIAIVFAPGSRYPAAVGIPHRKGQTA